MFEDKGMILAVTMLLVLVATGVAIYFLGAAPVLYTWALVAALLVIKGDYNEL